MNTILGASENRNHRNVITTQLRAQVVTAEAICFFCPGVRSLCVDRSNNSSDVLSGLPWRGEPRVGHGIPGADDRVQMMQLTQVKLAHILNSAMSQAITHQMQPIVNNPPR